MIPMFIDLLEKLKRQSAGKVCPGNLPTSKAE